MKIKLGSIASSRSGDKGKNSNVGIIFNSQKVYDWSKKYLSCLIIKEYFSDVVKGDVLRYELDNLLALNFILEDSLGGGGSDSLLNDAQGKTYGQAILLMEVDLPNKLKEYINE
tara:strand:- start:1807 stop:2148 length:342 start_codon:yes stop_codon:yes gene_type:complete